MEFFHSFGRDWFEFGKGGKTFHLGEDSLSGNEKNCLFRNDGDHFTEVGWVTGVASKLDGRGFVAADFDRDGDQDFLLVNDGQSMQYFENRRRGLGHWLVVQLAGEASNRLGIGARVTIEAGGKRQICELHLGSGYLSSPPPEAYFGVGAATRIDSIEVRWPDGRVDRVRDQAADRILIIDRQGKASQRLVERRAVGVKVPGRSP